VVKAEGELLEEGRKERGRVWLVRVEIKQEQVEARE
jgi:hypothetical protein